MESSKTGIMDRLLSSIVALVLAFLVWLYARSRDPELVDNVPIPVQVSLPPTQAEHYDLEVTGSSHIPVAFRGPPSRIRELRTILQNGGLHVDITFVVPEDRKGESRYLDIVRVDTSDIHSPPGVTPLIVEGRNRIPITLRRIVQRRLPVRLDPPPEERVSQAAIEPETVLVRGPKVILDRMRSVATQPYMLTPGSEAAADREVVAAGAIPLVREQEGRPIATAPDAVNVKLTYPPREKVFALTDVPVQFLSPANFPLRPQFIDPASSKIAVHVRGPAGKAPSGVSAFLDLTKHPFEPGRFAAEPLRFQLPKDFTLAEDPPPAPAFKLTPLHDARAAKPDDDSGS